MPPETGVRLAGGKEAKQKLFVSTYLIGVFHQNIFAFRLLHAKICYGANNTPAVGKGDVELRGEVCWTH